MTKHTMNPAFPVLSLATFGAGFVSLTLAGGAYAATYYVDPTAGSDSNPGTSQSAPWMNAPGMAAYRGTGKLVANLLTGAPQPIDMSPFSPQRF